MTQISDMCDILVIARFNENTTWAWGMAPLIKEYTKLLGNVGRESQSYIKYIIEEHGSQKSNKTRVCFTQGKASGAQLAGTLTRPLSFSDDVYEPIFGAKKVAFAICGQPHDCLRCLAPLASAIGIATPRNSFIGAFFSTTLGALRRVPLDV